MTDFFFRFVRWRQIISSVDFVSNVHKSNTSKNRRRSPPLPSRPSCTGCILALFVDELSTFYVNAAATFIMPAYRSSWHWASWMLQCRTVRMRGGRNNSKKGILHLFISCVQLEKKRKGEKKNGNALVFFDAFFFFWELFWSLFWS